MSGYLMTPAFAEVFAAAGSPAKFWSGLEALRAQTQARIKAFGAARRPVADDDFEPITGGQIAAAHAHLDRLRAEIRAMPPKKKALPAAPPKASALGAEWDAEVRERGARRARLAAAAKDRPAPDPHRMVFPIEFFGHIDGDGRAAERLESELRAARRCAEAMLRIDSGGGDLHETLRCERAIHDAREVGLKITARILDKCASGALVLASACDRVEAVPSARLMLHGIQGLDAHPEKRVVYDAELCGIFARKSGLPHDTVANMMTIDFWMSATEARAYGFVDQVLPDRRFA